MSTLYSISSDTLTGLADAVRQLNGTSAPLSPDGMIDGIEGHVCPSPTIQSLSVTQNGTYTAPSGVDGYSPVTVNVSGGGGASNVVVGTFKGTTDGAMDINVDYSGAGYPLAVIVYASDPNFDALIQRYAVPIVAFFKLEQETTPNYSASGTNNRINGAVRYKNSDTSPTTISQAGFASAYDVYANQAAYRNDRNTILRIRGDKTLSVLIESSTYYGFAKNYEYTYVILYSK